MAEIRRVSCLRRRGDPLVPTVRVLEFNLLPRHVLGQVLEGEREGAVEVRGTIEHRNLASELHITRPDHKRVQRLNIDCESFSRTGDPDKRLIFRRIVLSLANCKS